MIEMHLHILPGIDDRAAMLIDQAHVELFIETYLAAIINDKTTFYSEKLEVP